MTATMSDDLDEELRGSPNAAETAERLWEDPALDGYRIEAIGGRVGVAPPPDGDHVVALTQLMRLLDRYGLPEHHLEAVQGIGLALPRRSGEFALPDLSVVTEDFRSEKLPRGLYPPKVFRVVVEITSANWQDDLRIKPELYAAAEVPVYVIGDRHHDEVRVLSRPEDGEYRNVSTYKATETVTLPGAFPAEIPVDLLMQRWSSA